MSAIPPQLVRRRRSLPAAETTRPKVYTIPVHRNFADALVNGLLAQHGRDRMTLARGMILVPNNRAARAITDAFVRRAEPGLLLPRLVPVGDVGDDAMGIALDPAGSDPVPAAVDPQVRRFILARLVQQARAIEGMRIDAAEALRMGDALAVTIDTLHADEIAPEKLKTLDIASDLAVHWQKSLDLLAIILDQWPQELARLGRIDLAERRNHLLNRQARAWQDAPPPGFVVAAGITTSARAIANLQRVVARMPNGAVVLPGIDLASPEDEWEAISKLESHPQHHLCLLLDRMAVARSDVLSWRWGDGAIARAERARAVANAFAPAAFTHKWRTLDRAERSLPRVRLVEFAAPADEAQGIAIALREALETPARTAALITPDRALAGRVAAHLRRWGIDADDSAGRPLSVTPPGTLILGLIAAVSEGFAPVPLLSLLKHPLVMAGEGRLDWLDGVRSLDIALRGPRPAQGLKGMAAHLASGDKRTRDIRALAENWWTGVAPRFAALEQAFTTPNPAMPDLLEAVRIAAEDLAGDALWSDAAGRALSDLFADLAAAMPDGPQDVDARSLGAVMAQLMQSIAVRPPQGGHPRISIWGLLEARLQSADLLVLGGLNEGIWPASAQPDPWLAPKVRQELSLGGLDRRVGLSAHDLATALGGRDVLITRSRRDERAPTIASRFVLRLEAMLGGIERDHRVVALATEIDAHYGPAQLSKRPAPAPPASQRPRVISVTEVDRLKADPYAFYARRILGLTPLDPVDADPGPAWRGTAVHAIFEKWHKEDDLHPDALMPRVAALFDDPGIHPLLRALWQPRLNEAMQWIAAEIASDRASGRIVIDSEVSGSIEIAGVRLKGVADRIDRTGNALAIVDYKSGTPPSPKAVEAGFSMQLGLLGLIAERGGFPGISGKPDRFEYLALNKDKGQFGYRKSPVGGKTTALTTDNFVDASAGKFTEAAENWLTGAAPFTAKLHPEFAPYTEYDQLMRLAEWYGRD
jgi:ATP-dependent helicase/nuclease subunit B